MSKIIKVPKERIAVLIGKGGQTKKYIEIKTNTFLIINSKDGVVEIRSNDDAEGAISLWKASDVIKAIARGFSPKRAYKLLEDDIYIEIIDLEQFLSTRKSIKRIKGRIIGKSGKSRAMIEEMTNTYISIYGDTVSIIGEYFSFRIAKKAVMKLINGFSHSKVYKFLQHNYKKIQERKFSLWKVLPEIKDEFD